MTASSAKTKADVVGKAEQATSEAMGNYLDFLTTGHEKFVQSVKEARVRGARIGDELFDAVLESQREALATGKRLAANPADYAGNIKIFMEAATAAQERNMTLAKSLYREQADATAEMRSMFQGMFESSKDLGETARKLTTFWPKVA